eukprot:CAMPEP_0202881184 /NCGR_PEP_ID=MMETSP1391-20130828/36186_1 /ASSEMBLY_ACC=CAM_ASM_000867 /TAXON_ID=1034604 /ORGANISM="Chlamydomonas leiostraca, Strain SAG 11-49" /LENGTH=94 /DNA_ID=CAMNT_0049563837 /DNA_START=125 /DNA_END=409 /DNA_ORIENTATION=-
MLLAFTLYSSGVLSSAQGGRVFGVSRMLFPSRRSVVADVHSYQAATAAALNDPNVVIDTGGEYTEWHAQQAEREAAAIKAKQRQGGRRRLRHQA